MPKYLTQVKQPWYVKLLNLLSRIILQTIVLVTFVGILPTLYLLFTNLFEGNYISSLVCSGILLSLINANKSIQ